MLEHDHKPGREEPTGADAALGQEQESEGILVTRRTALVAGGVGVGGLILSGGLAVGVPTADAALPTTTAPEQLRLEFGNNPESEMTVSWSAPGTVPMPAPTLAYSTNPISATNRGKVIALPESAPLDLTKGPRRGPTSTSFLDGQTGQTTFHYHVPLKRLRPDTTYYYEVSDGAGSTASAQFRTAPRGRASFRFTAFGDQGLNPPRGAATTAGVINPGDSAGGPLFHLMVGDLAYANTANPPAVWAPWAKMVAAAASTFPWMPVPGNHELEKGTTDIHGAPGGVYNGPYGLGTYLARYLLPENGLTNWDGNSLDSNFYSFQVGTVLFVNLYGNDVIWQTSDFSSPNVTQYSGDLKADPENMALVPDDSNGTPNLQVQWLEQTLREARKPGSGVEMIVVQHHFPFASVDTGNSCDMGARTAFAPLFDKYEVDITLSGHNHNYCRSLPVRGFDPPSGVANGNLTNPFGTFAKGSTINTRRPTVRQSKPISIDGQEVFDTSLGTVHLVVGGGGAGSTIGETIDSATGFTQAHPFAQTGGNTQAIEDAPWLGFYDTANAYGYGVFDVDPGDRPGETSITFQWFSVPATGSPLPTTPVEKFTFTRRTQKIEAGEPEIVGRPIVGNTVTADPGRWSPKSAQLSYQWLRAALPIAGATAAKYTLTADDLGQQLQVQVTGTIPGNLTDTATSASVVGLAAPPAAHLVTITGKLAAGGSLAAVAAPLALGATRKFQWLRDGAPISGATDSTYDPLDADIGHVLEVQTTESVDGYDPVSVTSAPQPVSGAGTALTVPALTPQPTVGVAVQAEIAAEDAAHQWLLDGAEIDGAGSASYTPVPADAGKQLQLKLTAADGDSVISEPQAVAAAAFKTASRPGFGGTPVVGGTLSAIAGPWSPNPTLSYQWLQDGETIDGATAATLVVPAACAGKEVSLRVTAERTGYIARELISDAVKIGYGTIKSSMPWIEGDPRVDQTLHVIKGEWSAQAEFHYQWIVGGIARDGRSTGPAYKVRPEDHGQRVTVEVIGRMDGCEPVVRSSAATEPVRRA